MITKINKSLICNCCNNKGNTAGGFKWSYFPSVSEKIKDKKYHKKSVGQYDKNNILIKKYESIS